MKSWIISFILVFSMGPAFAQSLDIDTSVLDKTTELMEKSDQVLEKTEELVEKTGDLADKAGEVAAQAEQVSGNLGGCLIATATYGSELAVPVQQLREIRDNSLLQTSSGTSFMTGFNSIYYSFAPTVSDWERENPMFKEMVKITITPLISSLSILNYVEMDSEASVLGYGIGIILLNVGMYFVAPAVLIYSIRKKLE